RSTGIASRIPPLTCAPPGTTVLLRHMLAVAGGILTATGTRFNTTPGAAPAWPLQPPAHLAPARYPSPRMARRATVPRERLLRAGERLFAERGIDGVTVREINQLAGQRNSSALHYHFGSREGLLNEIRHQHRGPIEERRVAMLDALEREDRTDDLRALVE